MPRYAKTHAIVCHNFLVTEPGANTVDGFPNTDEATQLKYKMVARDPTPADGLLNTEEASDFLGLSPHTLAKWRISGRGPPYYRLGRRILYSPNILRLWSAANIRKSTSDPGTDEF